MKLISLLLFLIIVCVLCTYCSRVERFKNEENNNNSTELILHKGDITKLKIECIVNASNPEGTGCNIPNHCIDSAIHHAAGPELLEECKKLNGIPTGNAKITNGYRLPAKYVIHVTGPQASKSESKSNSNNKYDWKMLAKCYSEVLNLAKKHNIKEIAFCCISTGLYGYPQKESAKIAHETVKKWIENNKYKFDKIVFVVFKDDDYDIYKSLLV